MNGHAIDNDVNPQFVFDARPEKAGFSPLDEFAGALTGALFIVNFRNVDGIDTATQLPKLLQGGFRGFGLPRRRRDHLKHGHRNGRMQKRFLEAHG
jgi:hypothetical protein